jgi:hypothetical protein
MLQRLALAGEELIPGIIAYVSFVTVLVYVAAEDENVVAAFRSSWSLTHGHWLRLFLLLLVVTVGMSVVPSVIAALTQLVVGAVSGFEFGTLISEVVVLPFSLLVLGSLLRRSHNSEKHSCRRLDARIGQRVPAELTTQRIRSAVRAAG